jgi:hypothetical protein
MRSWRIMVSEIWGNRSAIDVGDVVLERNVLISARNGWNILVGRPLLIRWSANVRRASLPARFISGFWH